MARRTAAVLLTLLLAACGEGGWFGPPEEERLKGDRISILERGDAIAPDPETAGVRPTLSAPFDGDWPQPYGGSAHDAGHRALAERPALAWSVNIGEASNDEERRIVYPPVVADGKLFTLDAGGAVAAWSAGDGKQIWRADPTPEDEEDGFGGGIAYADGAVFFATGFAQVLAFDAATGAERWRARIPTPSRAAPSVDQGRVFAITIDNRLIAFDAKTGRQLWAFEAPPATAALLGGAAPAADLGAVIAATTTGEIIAFRAANGRITWDDALTAVRRVGVAEAIPAVRAPPVISDGLVVSVGAAGFVAVNELATGRRLWDRTFGGAEPPAIAGGFIFLTTDLGQLVALQRDDGKVVWSTDMRSAAGDVRPEDANSYVRLYAGPILAGGRLLVVRADGHILFFRPEDGELDHRIELPGETVLAPVVANRTLYVLTEAGSLLAYR